jgi:alanine racemase
MSNNPTVLEIDTNAIKYNLQYFRSQIQNNTKLLVVLKAFAYGSDSVAIAKLLEKQNVDYLAVAYTDEGIVLREANIKLPILILHPQLENFDKIIPYDLEPNLYNFRSLNKFIEIAKNLKLRNYPVHIKIDTGMNRLGFKENEISQLQTVLQSDSLKVVSIYSHLAASEDQQEKKFTVKQITSFKQLSKSLSQSLNYTPLNHISNTSAIINYPEAQFNMVRLGIGLYGFANMHEETAKLKNVCILKTKISQIHSLEKGESVSYNRKFIAEKDSKIGIIPIGYADGLNRNLSNNVGFVYIKNRKIPIVGTICMDMTMIYLTGIDCKEGDEVIIFNHQNHILEIANKTSTIPYEVLTSISQRVNRKLI